jgi:hypothetical protein
MGLTILTLDVAAPAMPDRRAAVEFLIDSGAVYSFVPRSVLESLHVEPCGERQFRGERPTSGTMSTRRCEKLAEVSSTGTGPRTPAVAAVPLPRSAGIERAGGLVVS